MPSTPKLQCRHIFPDGHRCGSPCLRREPFCYYHHTTRKPKTTATCTDPNASFELPDLDDRSGIQSAITMVLQRLANGNLDPKRARLLLYGLQIAIRNLPKSLPALNPVEDLIEDPNYGTIAPETHIDTAFVDALSDIICQRMNLPTEPPSPKPSEALTQGLAAALNTAHSASPTSRTLRTFLHSKSRPNSQVLKTLQQKHRAATHQNCQLSA